MGRMLSIGAFARRTDTKVETIRYCQEIGLMPEAGRTAGGQRRYSEAELDRLAFICHARELGFPLEDIRALLDLTDDPDRSCAKADAITRRQLARVERRMRRLEALRTELNRMIERCSGGEIADCRVIEVLRDHSECGAEHAQPGLG